MPCCLSYCKKHRARFSPVSSHWLLRCSAIRTCALSTAVHETQMVIFKNHEQPSYVRNSENNFSFLSIDRFRRYRSVMIEQVRCQATFLVRFFSTISKKKRMTIFQRKLLGTRCALLSFFTDFTILITKYDLKTILYNERSGSVGE